MSHVTIKGSSRPCNTPETNVFFSSFRKNQANSSLRRANRLILNARAQSVRIFPARLSVSVTARSWMKTPPTTPELSLTMLATTLVTLLAWVRISSAPSARPHALLSLSVLPAWPLPRQAGRLSCSPSTSLLPAFSCAWWSALSRQTSTLCARRKTSRTP